MPRTLGRACTAAAGVALTSAVLLGATATAASAAPQAVTSYTFTSEAGDYIGQGGTGSYVAPGATIRVSGNAGELTMSVDQGGEWWYVDIAAPRDEQLRPGRYTDAERASFRTGRAPGLDVSGNGRGCNEVYGSFTVHQIEVTDTGSIAVFDASFTQRCESGTAPRLTGRVKYQAYPLSYRYASDPGDYIGQGQTVSYDNATSIFALRGTTAGVTFSVSGNRSYWDVELAPPAGETLQPGTYTDAQRAAFREPGHPGLDAHGSGRGCNTLTGSFTIHELVADAAGTVTALSATFEQHCEGATPALRGTIHYYA